MLVNNSTLSDSEKTDAHNAVLTADIVINNKTVTSSSANVTEWTPISNFNAVFDGNGHTISGLYCRDTTGSYVGLFANTSTSSAVIKNVGIVNSYISSSQYVGAICGYNNYGTILNCSNSGTVEGKSDSSSDTYVGGICGYLCAGTIKGCNNSATVSGKYAGGICGYMTASSTSNAYIYTSANTGSVSGSDYVGGIVGYMYYSGDMCSYIYNSYNIGTVECTDLTFEGGITGSNYSGYVYNSYNYDNTVNFGIGYRNNGTYSNCYYRSGGISTGSSTAASADEFADGSIAYLLNNKATGGTTWYQNIDMGEADAYPVLSDEHYRVYYDQSNSTYTNIRTAITDVCGADNNGMNMFYTLDIATNSLTITGKGDMADYSSSSTAPWYAYRNYIKYISVDEDATLDDYATYGLKNLTTVYCYEDSAADNFFTDSSITKKYFVSEDVMSISVIDEENKTFTITINTDNFAGYGAKYLDEVRVIVNNNDENNTVKNYQDDTSNDKYINFVVTYDNTTGKDANIQGEVIAKTSADASDKQYYVTTIYELSEG